MYTQAQNASTQTISRNGKFNTACEHEFPCLVDIFEELDGDLFLYLDVVDLLIDALDGLLNVFIESAHVLGILARLFTQLDSVVSLVAQGRLAHLQQKSVLTITYLTEPK